MNLSEVDLPCNAGHSQKHRLFVGKHNSKTVNRSRQGTPSRKATLNWQSLFYKYQLIFWRKSGIWIFSFVLLVLCNRQLKPSFGQNQICNFWNSYQFHKNISRVIVDFSTRKSQNLSKIWNIWISYNFISTYRGCE